MIDVHHHVLPSFYMEAIRGAGFDRSGGIVFPEWRVEDSLRVMDGHGVDTAVVSVSTPGVAFLDDPAARRGLARRANDWTAELIAAHPGRFAGLATLPLPDVDASLDEIDHALGALRLDGVTLLASAGGRYLGDAVFEPVVAELDRRAAVAFVHPTTPPGAPLPGLNVPTFAIEFVADTTRAIAQLILSGTLERHRRVTFVCAHAGGFAPYITDRLEAAWQRVAEYQARGPAGPLAYLRALRYDTAASANPFTLPALVALAGPEAVLFGTDYPFVAEAAVGRTLEGAAASPALDDVGRALVTDGNARQIYRSLRRTST